MPVNPTSTLPVHQIAEQSGLSDAARTLLRDGQSGDAYVIALRNAGLYPDAVAFVAHWLGKREAIWWGCQCVWRLMRPQPNAQAEPALAAIVGWVMQPSETARRGCEKFADELTMRVPVGALAQAVFYSGGSLLPPELPPLPAPEGATPKCVIASLTVAGARHPDYFREFVFLGVDIAHGQNLWA
jgi:hypothetical protein